MKIRTNNTSKLSRKLNKRDYHLENGRYADFVEDGIGSRAEVLSLHFKIVRKVIKTVRVRRAKIRNDSEEDEAMES